MKKIFFLLLLASHAAQAQELFVVTEPASNMPTHSLGIRLSNYLMKEKGIGKYDYHLVPELMWGANKKLMLHANMFLSDQAKAFVNEGGSLYAKYRFLSKDDVHRHFRMAAFGRYSINNSAIHQDEIELYGHNSGYQAGLIATQLLHKVALSSSVSYVQAVDNGAGNKLPEALSRNAVNYSFSFGKLMLPRQYTGYGQTNLNLMVEFLGQTLGDNGKSYMDVVPSLQLILNSQARIDVGYRQQLYSSMYRSGPNGFLLRFEYLLFNIL
ncbi:hypothetical protein [Foetidibacter luteolus]|uniref:hypothetical protein n=1 Tax=Foetidibacter luteolus TaxID=2608880 RepID=UPI00129AB812|nr:hypothetical protein [Foetidibacter luteolus]